MRLILFLFSCNILFSANIGVVGWRRIHTYLTDYLEKELKPLGHDVKHLWRDGDFDSCDIIVSCNFHDFLEKYKDKVIMSCWEPEVIVPEHSDFERLSGYLAVLTWNHDICKHKGFEKFYYPGDVINEKMYTPLPFREKKLSCMIASYLTKWNRKELYSIRRNVVKFYQRYYPEKLALYGKRGWGFRFKPIFKGFADNKSKILSQHKFNYCFENWQNDYHYISEKIFESFDSYCIPIYLGSTRINELIPEETFIDARKFKSIQDLHDYLENMNEETYNTYIDAIKAFNKTKMRYIFSNAYHNQTVLRIIKESLQ